MSLLGYSQRPLGRTGLAGAIAFALLAAFVPAAMAAPGVSLTGTKIKYLAAPATINVVSLSYDEGDDLFTVVDTGVATLTPGKGCHRPSGAPDTEVACTPTSKPVKSFLIKTGDLNDIVNVSAPIAGTVSLGAGNDLAETQEGSQKLIGSTGSDTFDGGPGSDRYSGGGGTGIDIVSYLSHADPATVTLRNRQPDDGNAEDFDPAKGRHDIISANVEGAIGSQSADTFTGTETGEDIFDGGPGDDIIHGLSGGDALRGSGGHDTITTVDSQGGFDFSDHLVGGPGDDTLIASLGDDEVEGGPGFDWLDSGGGDDVLRSNEEGPAMLDEFITCGDGGDDDLFFDPADAPFDNPASGCETRVPIFTE